MKYKIAALLISLLTMPALADVINFDDLDGSGVVTIADGYAGFNWNNGDGLIGTVSQLNAPNTGYANGTVSHANTAFNWGGASGVAIQWAGTGNFNFTSAFFTSAWYDQEIAFEGYKAGNLIYASDSYAINTQSPTLVDLQWSNIDTLYIYNTAWQWAMDDFTFTKNGTDVPESSGWLLMILGLVGVVIRGLRQA